MNKTYGIALFILCCRPDSNNTTRLRTNKFLAKQERGSFFWQHLWLYQKCQKIEVYFSTLILRSLCFLMLNKIYLSLSTLTPSAYLQKFLFINNLHPKLLRLLQL